MALVQSVLEKHFPGKWETWDAWEVTRRFWNRMHALGLWDAYAAFARDDLDFTDNRINNVTVLHLNYEVLKRLGTADRYNDVLLLVLRFVVPTVQRENQWNHDW
eukprot:5905491-Alexandrium_andersonii.AAC.1